MNAPVTEITEWGIRPLTTFNVDAIQQYWQTLYMHDLLRHRLCDIKDPTWSDVKDMIVRMGNTMFHVCRPDTDEIIGDFMLEHFTGRAAQIHFSMHPDVKFPEAIRIGKFVLDNLLYRWKRSDQTSFLSSVYGLTPINNRTACIYVLKAGMKKIGVLPDGITNQGEVVDAMLTIASRKK